MKQMNQYLVAATMAAALVCTASPARAEHDKELKHSNQSKASELIGKEVKNTTDESLGKIDELIINTSSGSVPYAIIAHGGALGVGRTKTAVPMSALECSSDGKYLTLAASKEDLKMASKMAPTTWAVGSDAQWVKSVDGFYGTPGSFASNPNDRHQYRQENRDQNRDQNRDRVYRDRVERDQNRDRVDDDRVVRDRDRGDLDRNREERLYVRDPQQKGAEALMRPADAILCEKVCNSIDNVQVTVNEGTVTLRGTVESEEARRNLETRVRSIPGVQRVDNNLRVR